MNRCNTLLAALLGAITFATTSPASAQWLDDPYEDRRLMLDVHTAFFGPYGLGGVSVEYAPHPAVVLGVGGGGGVFGPRASVIARGRPFRAGGHTLGPELSVSFEGNDIICDLGDGCDDMPVAIFARPGAFYEALTRGGFHFRAYGGLGVMVNAGRENGGPPRLFYVGLAFGYAVRTGGYRAPAAPPQPAPYRLE